MFEGEQFCLDKLKKLAAIVPPEKLVIDLSCRKISEKNWAIATNRWQTITQQKLDHDLLSQLAPFCSEFLIHAADVEGQCAGIDTELVQHLSGWGGFLPITYAGGARSIDDLATINQTSAGRIDLTIGSALDLFGGHLVKYTDCLRWNNQ